jgi:hypothetical protein
LIACTSSASLRERLGWIGITKKNGDGTHRYQANVTPTEQPEVLNHQRKKKGKQDPWIELDGFV